MIENTDLECLAQSLKSGEYDGTHIMQAWLAIDRLCKLEDSSLQEDNKALREELVALKQSIPKIKVDAIMSLRELGSWDGREDGEYYYSASTIKKFADEIEDGS